MKAGWEIKALGDFATFENGDRGKNYPGRKAFVERGIPFINAGHLNNGVIDLSEMNYIPTDHFRRLGSGKIKKGDILFCLRGSLGKFALIDNLNEGAIASSLVIVRPKSDLLATYLSYYFASPLCSREIGQYGNGAAQPNLSAKSLAAFKIPVPPLEEQQRIVAVLDEAFEGLDRARANAEANLQNAREFFALNFEHELLNYREVSEPITIGEICTGFEYGTSAKSLPKGAMPVLRMGNIQSGEIDWGDLVYTDDASDINKLVLNDGDVLFNRTNSLEHVGKAAIYRGEYPAIFAGYLIRLHFDRSKLLPDFLNLFLNSEGARSYGRSISGKSVNQANISASKLKTYPINIPPTPIQEAIVTRAESIRRPLSELSESYTTKLRDISNLRQSLLQKAFAGELT